MMMTFWNINCFAGLEASLCYLNLKIWPLSCVQSMASAMFSALWLVDIVLPPTQFLYKHCKLLYFAQLRPRGDILGSRYLFLIVFILPAFVFWCSTGHCWVWLFILFFKTLHRRPMISSYNTLFCWRVFLALASRKLGIHLVLFNFPPPAVLHFYVLFTIFFLSFVILCSWMDPRVCPCRCQLPLEEYTYKDQDLVIVYSFDTTRISSDTLGP